MKRDIYFFTHILSSRNFGSKVQWNEFMVLKGRYRESGNKINFARISFNKFISLLAGKKSYIMSDGALGLTKNLNCSFENNIYVLERCSRKFLVF